ncbi:hypothetical protein Poly41_51050 [Novipirellula artificiosorum]|uniref:Uncharacterized protein n=1 Tax=Novipirellula artificiosorum TaxID=2528016 RepID=A0A5C6DCB0_9BACT|nr:hypothetical protein Poly41_51050 [Novipirellula artificiosorum]
MGEKGVREEGSWGQNLWGNVGVGYAGRNTESRTRNSEG